MPLSQLLPLIPVPEAEQERLLASDDDSPMSSSTDCDAAPGLKHLAAVANGLADAPPAKEGVVDSLQGVAESLAQLQPMDKKDDKPTATTTITASDATKAAAAVVATVTTAATATLAAATHTVVTTATTSVAATPAAATTAVPAITTNAAAGAVTVTKTTTEVVVSSAPATAANTDSATCTPPAIEPEKSKRGRDMPRLDLDDDIVDMDVDDDTRKIADSAGDVAHREAESLRGRDWTEDVVDLMAYESDDSEPAEYNPDDPHGLCDTEGPKVFLDGAVVPLTDYLEVRRHNSRLLATKPDPAHVQKGAVEKTSTPQDNPVPTPAPVTATTSENTATTTSTATTVHVSRTPVLAPAGKTSSPRKAPQPAVVKLVDGRLLVSVNNSTPLVVEPEPIGPYEHGTAAAATRPARGSPAAQEAAAREAAARRAQREPEIQLNVSQFVLHTTIREEVNALLGHLHRLLGVRLELVGPNRRERRLQVQEQIRNDGDRYFGPRSDAAAESQRDSAARGERRGSPDAHSAPPAEGRSDRRRSSPPAPRPPRDARPHTPPRRRPMVRRSPSPMQGYRNYELDRLCRLEREKKTLLARLLDMDTGSGLATLSPHRGNREAGRGKRGAAPKKSDRRVDARQ